MNQRIVGAQAGRLAEAPPPAHAARRAGQVALEYLLVTAVMLAMVSILAVFLVATREHGARVLDLVAADAP
ncbi:MAG: hypothetical protein K8T26_09645 [Lentisphaerae bacterium]|nr:hypothetical protein [Lentisphaerota bacterium]